MLWRSRLWQLWPQKGETAWVNEGSGGYCSVLARLAMATMVQLMREIMVAMRGSSARAGRGDVTTVFGIPGSSSSQRTAES